MATNTKLQNKDKLGSEVSSWVGKMVGKAASGVWKVAVGAAGVSIDSREVRIVSRVVRVGLFGTTSLLLVMVIAVVSWWAHLVLDEERVSESMCSAELIISALSDYHERFGEYPPALDALVPDFMDDIPAPTAGNRKWFYRTKRSRKSDNVPLVGDENRKRYVFGFEGDNYRTYPTYQYDSDDKDWWIDTK